jgi:hypothetical protein
MPFPALFKVLKARLGSIRSIPKNPDDDCLKLFKKKYLLPVLYQVMESADGDRISQMMLPAAL